MSMKRANMSEGSWKAGVAINAESDLFLVACRSSSLSPDSSMSDSLWPPPSK